MLNKVFISYSTKDEAVAKQICELIEKEGLPCWIAPRDVPPGGRYYKEIINVINNCRALIFIFSENSINSTAVLAEVESAFSKGKQVFPFRIQNIEPGENFEFFIKIFQWCDGFKPPFELKVKEIIDAIKQNSISETSSKAEIGTEFEFVSESEFINNAFMPFAAMINGCKEHEVNNNREGGENALNRLIELITKFLVFSLISGFHKKYDVSQFPEILKLLLNLKSSQRNKWVEILEKLTSFHTKESTPFLQTITSFLNEKVDISKDINVSYDFLQSKLSYKEKHSNTILDYIRVLNLYSESFQNKGLRIPDSKKYIKNPLIELINKSPFNSKLDLVSIAGVNPNRIEKTFEHTMLNLRGLDQQIIDTKLKTENWEYIENTHIVLINKDNINEFLDLYPFVFYDEKNRDVLFWEKTTTFKDFFFRGVVVKNIVEIPLSIPNVLINELEKISNDGFNLPREIIDFSELISLLSNVENQLKKTVTNPFCLKNFSIILSEIGTRIENDVENYNGIMYDNIRAKIEDIRTKSSKGIYPKLIPTDIDYILLDENQGKYIVPELFYENNPEIIKTINGFSGIFKKQIDPAVGAVFYLAFLEASIDKNCILGVEHFMIAISKICDETILNWYDSIGVSPKNHRDMIRYAIRKKEKHLDNGRDGIIIKERVRKIFDMAIKEVNLAKRETITLHDLFSAILREGESLPIILLTNLYDLTNDQLLSEFYHLSRLR
jgi:hypothetical protein